MPHTMLYVVADADDPAFRAAISSFTGGVVDYFDARVATPTLAALSAYDCVFAHPNIPYADPVLLGDNLADYVDQGGQVILGFVNFSGVWEIQGRIRNVGYSPVASGAWLFGPADSYAGDGATDHYAGVLALNGLAHEQSIVLQGLAIADGTYTGTGEPVVAFNPNGRVVYVNGTGHASFGGTGDWAKIVANACWLQRAQAGSMLYVVGDGDDFNFRSDIAAIGGGVVDYFDARVATPTAALLNTYDCVFAHSNFVYADPVLLGDRLADYVDVGGKVALGILNLSAGWPLLGRIMTPGYNPVTSAGAWPGPPDTYAGDGTTDYYAGVVNLSLNFQDPGVVLQPPGVADGSYLGTTEILLAYRPDGQVVYVNGTGHASWGPAGQWAKLIANVCGLASPQAGSILYAPCDNDDFLFRSDIAAIGGTVVDFFNASGGTPSPALLGTYDCVFTHPNAPYADPVLFGDQLADFVDAGGKAILGVATAYDGFALGGRIVTPAYHPSWNPTIALHFPSGPDLGDGTGPLYAGVSGLSCFASDFAEVQGAGKANGHYQSGELLAAQRPDGRVIYLNGTGHVSFSTTGDWPRLVHNACAADLSSGHKILYAPADPDDPAYRAQIAAETGGVVDYFNASAGTPSAALLAGYDCVYTWPNFTYADPVLMGDRLADFVDAGGQVVLGSLCTYTLTPNHLEGRIMAPGYSPVVSPTGTNHFAFSAYAGNGTTCLHHRVLLYDSFVRDFLALQGDGIVDARYADGEIAVAYRPDRRVVYMNGLGLPYGGGTGDWPILIGNACECEIGPGLLLGASAGGGAELFNLDLVTGSGWLIGPTTPGTELEYDPVAGQLWIQSGFSAQEVSVGNGSAIGGPVPNGALFNSLEYALGRMWAGWVGGGCDPATFGTLDPATGISSAVAVAMWPRNISGLAFDYSTSTMYAVSGCIAAGSPELFKVDVTNGATSVIGILPPGLGSLQFGPDGDLYAGGDASDGGNLYRVNPTTGAIALVGPTGRPTVTGLTLVPSNAVAADPAPISELALAAPFPNPSHTNLVRLDFTLPKPGRASLELYDVAGRRVWSKDMGSLPAGPHHAEWNGLTTSGVRAASGVYFVRLHTDLGERRVTLVRLQ